MIEYHRILLNDLVRGAAYRRAIEATVRPGDVVADLGAGTGLLSLWAARAGARRVYAVEGTDMARLGERLVADNGLDDRVTIIEGVSHEVRLPERVDVLVAEIFGSFADEEFFIEHFAWARKHWLKPGGRVVPSAFTVNVALVEAPELYAELTGPWHAQYEGGLDLRAARTLAVNNLYARTLPAAAVASAAATVDRVDLTRDTHARRGGAVTCSASRDAELHGLVCWWEATLSPGVVLSTAPDAPATHWQQVFLPFERPVRVKAGERVGAELRWDTTGAEGIIVAWGVRPERGKAQQLTNVKGEPAEVELPPEELPESVRRAAEPRGPARAPDAAGARPPPARPQRPRR